MISMTAIKSAGGASKYMVEQAAVEYYAEQTVPSEWHGKGAELQWLQGQVTQGDLMAQLEGRVKELGADGELQDVRLGVERNGEMKHRCGWDMTFSAPKSVSIESEVFAQQDVRQAHDKAVLAAMKFLEARAAQTRKDGELVKTGNLTYATFQHATSRAGDPQTHTHVIVANVTFDEFGKAYSLSNERLMEFRTTADALYKNELANELSRMGYTIQYDRSGNFEIKGYTKENLEVFSKRTEQIKEALEERGLRKETASHGARQYAALDTREAKDHSEVAQLHRDKWQGEALGAGISSAERHPIGRGYAEQGEAQKAVENAIDHLLEREMAFSEKDLWREAGKFSQGKADIYALEKEVQKLIDSKELLQRTDGKFTSANAVQAEREMGHHLAAGKGEHLSVMSADEFMSALSKFESAKGFELSSEQRNAARMILTIDDRFQGVQGLAGTGKTTMLEFVREAAESKGWTVQGFSNGGAQADKMQQESGIQSSTTARYNIEFAKVERDATLAKRAIETFEARGGMTGQQADAEKLMREVREGNAQLERDSSGREYVLPRDGGVYCLQAHERVREFAAANLNHLGLTDSKYVIGNDGVFKQGGSLVNEAAANFLEKVHESTKDAGFVGKAAEFAAQKTVGMADKWVKCGPLEAAAVRGQAQAMSLSSQKTVFSELEKQAAQIGKDSDRVLNICDEASMSGQREFSKVIHATEQTGARTVFLGDSQQHQSVEAGKAFELAQQHMPTATLGAESIRRQTTDHAKEMVANVLSGRHDQAMSSLPAREVSPAQDAVREKYSALAPLTPDQKKEGRAELAEASKADNKEVIKTLAKDYASLDSDKRDRTLVITSTNSDKGALNAEIRSALKERGELADGKQISTLEKADVSRQQATVASNYEKGHVVEFTSAVRSLGLEKGAQLTVEKSDSFSNMVTARADDGRVVTFNPEKLKGVEVYNEHKGKEFSIGDKVTFTKNDQDLSVKNGQTGTVEKFDGKDMTVKMDNGEKREINTQEYKHLDHAYAVTSFKSQGQTVDLVLNHHNTEHGQHGDRETYVNFTRAREDVVVYTQNVEKAAQQAGLTLDKEVALPKELDRGEATERQPNVPDLGVSAAKEADHVQQHVPAVSAEHGMESEGRVPRDAELAQAALATTERLGNGVEHAPNFDHLRDAVLTGADYVRMERDSGGREFFFKDGETFTADAYGSKHGEIVEQAASREGEVAPRTETEAVLRDGKLASEAIDTSSHRSEMNQGQPNFESLERGLKDGSVTLSTDSTGREFFHRDGETFTRDAYSGAQQYHELLDQAHKGIDLALSNKSEAGVSAESVPGQSKDLAVVEPKQERGAENNPWSTTKDLSPAVEAKAEKGDRAVESKVEKSKPEDKSEAKGDGKAVEKGAHSEKANDKIKGSRDSDWDRGR